MVVAIDVQYFLAFDTQDTIIQLLESVPNGYFENMSHPESTHSVKPGRMLALARTINAPLLRGHVDLTSSKNHNIVLGGDIIHGCRS
jgi:hypothetical protein